MGCIEVPRQLARVSRATGTNAELRHQVQRRVLTSSALLDPHTKSVFRRPTVHGIVLSGNNCALQAGLLLPR
jgi:hypothetical protein